MPQGLIRIVLPLLMLLAFLLYVLSAGLDDAAEPEQTPPSATAE
jgi:Na+-transporting methylmalonyl-CoA/oxaloacetate decarboxylase gamma subunit